MFVKPGQRPDDPARQLVVRGPTGALLNPSGGNLPETAFWWRRLRDGDVVAATPPTIPAGVRRIGPDGQVIEPRAAAMHAEVLAEPAADPPPAAAPAEVPPPSPAFAGAASLRLTAAEWAHVGGLEVTGGEGGEALTAGTADLQRDPAARLMTHEEYLAEIKA